VKTDSKIRGRIVRGATVAVLLLSALVTLSSVAKPAQARTLTFAERVAYQRSIDGVYWRHRTWPKERHDPKPSLDAVMSEMQAERIRASCERL